MANAKSKLVELVVAEFTGGEVNYLDSRHPVVWLDLDRGTRFNGDSWAAITTREHVEALRDVTGAELVSVSTWGGESFGDGNCGTVHLDGRSIVHGSIVPTFAPPGYRLVRGEHA